MLAPGTLHITGDEAADALLNSDANALLIGMLLDQQIPMERAFAGPAVLRERLGHLDPARIAGMVRADVVEVCSRTPAIHRFPAAMGARIQELCAQVVSDYEGEAANIWADAVDAEELRERLADLPGFGPDKTRIFIALLAKRRGVRPAGWEEVVGELADEVARSVADADSAESVEEIRAYKRARKAAGR